jgi:hypothetical protein
MNVNFLSDGSDFRSRGTSGYLAKNRGGTGMFWWTILITLLIGLAVFCWFFSIMVFKYPEKPFNYHLLTKLKKIEEIREFAPEHVPHGKFLGAKEMLSSYYYYNTDQLRHANSALKRNYILNFTEESPVYAKGTYTVTQSRPLTEKDVMPVGWVVRARSVDMEDVELELLLPGAASEESPYKEGEAFTLDNKATFGTLIHIERTPTDGVCATVVPLVYGKYAVGGDKKLALEAPEKINVEASFPVTSSENNSSIGSSAKVASKGEP